jgi:guanylate kinase
MEKAKANNQILLLNVDVEGATKLQESSMFLNTMFVLPCDPAKNAKSVLAQRLMSRGTKDQEQIQTFLEDAEDEIKRYRTTDIFKHTLVNDDLKDAVDELFNVVGSMYKNEI